MKPAWSRTSTGFLPQASANARAVAIVSSRVVMARTTSTSAIIGAGLKKCTPQTSSGRPVSIAISTTGRVDVFVARMAPSRTTRSSSLKRCFFVARSSTIDSSTRSHSPSAPRSVTAWTRPRTESRSAVSSLPRSTCLARDFSSPATIASAVVCERLRRITSMPALAATSAIPEPMIPEPTTPRRVTVMRASPWMARRAGYRRVAALGQPQLQRGSGPDPHPVDQQLRREMRRRVRRAGRVTAHREVQEEVLRLLRDVRGILGLEPDHAVDEPRELGRLPVQCVGVEVGGEVLAGGPRRSDVERAAVHVEVHDIGTVPEHLHDVDLRAVLVRGRQEPERGPESLTRGDLHAGLEVAVRTG